LKALTSVRVSRITPSADAIAQFPPYKIVVSADTLTVAFFGLSCRAKITTRIIILH